MNNETVTIDHYLAAYLVDGLERIAEVALTELARAGSIDLGADLRRIGDARGVNWTSAPTAQQLGVVPTVSVCGPLPAAAGDVAREVYELIGREPGQSVVRLLDRIPGLESVVAVLSSAAAADLASPRNDAPTKAGKKLVKALKHDYPLFTTGYDDILMALAVRGPVVLVRSDRPELATALTSRPSASSTRSA